MTKPVFLLFTVLTLLSAPLWARDYLYDDLNRLVKVIEDTGATVSYTYDAAGNLLRVLPTNLSSSPLSGQVVSADGLPLAGVTVTVGQESTVTDEQGHYQFPHPFWAGTYVLQAFLPPQNITPQMILLGPDQPTVRNLVSAGPTDCALYVIDDVGKNHSQLWHLNPTPDLDRYPVGRRHRQADLEALDIHPDTDQLFAAAGAHGESPGHLYQVNAQTGDIFRIGPTGFQELNGLSFNGDGTLWGWANHRGLIQIDPNRGQGVLVWAFAEVVEDLSWDNAGRFLYLAQGTELRIFDSQIHQVTKLPCPPLPDRIEGLETLPDGSLLVGVQSQLFLLDPSTCTLDLLVSTDLQLTTPTLTDIEGIAWPRAACLPDTTHFQFE